MKTVGMYIYRGIDYLVWAGFFGLLTVWYWFAFDTVLETYIWNVLGISLALIIDKIRLKRIYKKVESGDDKTQKKFGRKDVSSLKTSLYLFYIFALIASQILALDTAIEVSESVRNYFQSVEMGIILLFAIDTFFGYLIGDDERVRKFRKKYRDKL
jgi:hypothetical protein